VRPTAERDAEQRDIFVIPVFGVVDVGLQAEHVLQALVGDAREVLVRILRVRQLTVSPVVRNGELGLMAEIQREFVGRPIPDPIRETTRPATQPTSPVAELAAHSGREIPS
jgi:hypothetical protein